MSWGNEYEFESTIEIWEPNKHLRTTFPDSETTRIAVDYFLERRGNKTVLRLVHSGFSEDADWDELYDCTHRGWDFSLWGLQHYLQYHKGTPRAVIYVRRFIDQISRQEAWSRLMSKNGIVSDGTLEASMPGTPYNIKTAIGDSLSGKVRLYLPPKDFSATVENLNHAVMRLQLDELWGRRDVTLTLSTYGLPQSRVNSLRANWTRLFETLFAEGS